MSSRFSRSERLFGASAMERLQKARVLVVGLGAVGSYAVEGLVRSGIGCLRVVDFDTVRLSNINRQLYALNSTLGSAKTDVARDRILDINPDCELEVRSCFIDHESVAPMLTPRPDVMIDAIDSLSPKVELLAAGVRSGVPLVLSAMGAASRTDPAQLQIGDISETHGCPLARLVRKRLKRRGVEHGIRCVYSTEPPIRFFPGDEGEIDDRERFFRGRPREVLGSFSCLTGIVGLTLAREAVVSLVADERCAGPAVLKEGVGSAILHALTDS